MSVSVSSKTINQQWSEAWFICKYLAEKSILEREFSLTEWPNAQSTLDLEYRRVFKILTADHMGCAIQLYRNQWLCLYCTYTSNENNNFTVWFSGGAIESFDTGKFFFSLIYATIVLPITTTVYTVAKPARQFGHAMQISNHHYSFLYNLIVFTVCEHRLIFA